MIFININIIIIITIIIIAHRLHADVVRSPRHQAVEGRLGGSPGVVHVLGHVGLAEHRVLGPDGGLVGGVVARGEGGLPENQQRGLIPEPDDEPARRIGLGGEVGGEVGLGLLVLEHRVQLELVGGAGAEVAQGVLRLPDHEVADGGPGLGERDQLELEAGVLADVGRVPGDQGLLASLRGDGEVGGRVGRRGDARRPGQPVRDGVVGVVEVEVVLGARQP